MMSEPCLATACFVSNESSGNFCLNISAVTNSVISPFPVCWFVAYIEVIILDIRFISSVCGPFAVAIALVRANSIEVAVGSICLLTDIPAKKVSLKFPSLIDSVQRFKKLMSSPSLPKSSIFACEPQTKHLILAVSSGIVAIRQTPP